MAAWRWGSGGMENCSPSAMKASLLLAAVAGGLCGGVASSTWRPVWPCHAFAVDTTQFIHHAGCKAVLPECYSMWMVASQSPYVLGLHQ